MNFDNFGFEENLLEGIKTGGYKTPTPVQQQVIPLIMEGKDVMATAQTGTGKTAAFVLPLIQKITTTPGQHDSIKALIIVPTRELAVQISQHVEGLSYYTNISSIAVYGGGDGSAFIQEKNALSNGADMVICTPGKFISHLNMGYVKLHDLKYLVLDEADRMLDMGFYDDIMKIISFLPSKRQTLLLSATMPHKIQELSKKILKAPALVNISIAKPPERIKQLAYVVYETQKLPLIKLLLKDAIQKVVLIFCSRKENVKALTRELKRSGFNAGDIHSDLQQSEREEVLMKFKSRQLPILIATDILSRGIDIDNIDLVINYDVPNDGEDYVHRIGRTARAQTNGIAITLITEQEQRKFFQIEELIERVVEKQPVPEVLGISPVYDPTKKPAKNNRRKPFSKVKKKG